MKPTIFMALDKHNKATDKPRDRERKLLRRRHRRAWRFKVYCFTALVLATGFLLLFFYNIGSKAYPAFVQARILVDVNYRASSREIPKRAIDRAYRDFVSHAYFRLIPRRIEKNPELLGTTREELVLATSEVDQYLKHSQDRYHRLIKWLQDTKEEYETILPRIEKKVEPVQDRMYAIDARLAKLEFDLPPDIYAKSEEVAQLQAERKNIEQQITEMRGGIVARYEEAQAKVREIEAMYGGREMIEDIDRLAESGRIQMKFNTGFFGHGDSKLPEYAGIKAAAVGSMMVLVITLLVSFPIGVLSAVYLEEFAPDNKFTQTIEVNINNLAAVPSILFGLLGLAIFINFFHVPRSSVLVGGLTLSLRTLPILIIATRAALRAVPDSIRQGALSVGATPWQSVVHHVLPLSLPGILTGTIIGLAQAMGETAPLLIVGMVAFIPEAPTSFTDPTTVLPAQIFTWSSESLRGFVEKTAAGIVVLLVILLLLNGTAILLRNKFERKW